MFRHARLVQGINVLKSYIGKDVDGRDKPGHDDVNQHEASLVLQNKPAQIRVLRQIADMLLHVSGVDADGFAVAIRRDE